MLRTVGSPASWVVSRIDKLDHYQTILYEIDMLRFANGRIPPFWEDATEADVWVYLECFLLHYRNLINFFGAAPTDISDLSIRKPEEIWPDKKDRPTDADLAGMRATGESLKQKYDDKKNKDDTISRYLQHCTTYRIGFKEWHPDEMMDEIRQTLELFEKHLPEFKPATNSKALRENP